MEPVLLPVSILPLEVPLELVDLAESGWATGKTLDEQPVSDTNGAFSMVTCSPDSKLVIKVPHPNLRTKIGLSVSNFCSTIRLIRTIKRSYSGQDEGKQFPGDVKIWVFQLAKSEVIHNGAWGQVLQLSPV